MKKSIISAIAFLSLAACMQDEVVSVEHSDAIVFDNAFVENTTRATTSFENKDDLDNFNVWGFINSPEATLFEGTEVVKGNNGAWSYAGESRYWIPGHVYYFAALAPVSANYSVDTFTASDLGLTFTNVDGNEDLIYAESHMVAQESGKNVPVAFQFQHLLSKVKFTFENKMGNEYINVRITDIKVKSARTASIDLKADPKVWIPQSGKEVTISFGALEKITADNQSSTDDYFVIPSADDYDIEFDVQLEMDGVNGTEILYTAKKTASVPGEALMTGTAYNFSAAINPDILNLDTIEFTVDDVEDWDEASDLSKISIASKLGGEVTLTENVRIPDSDVIEVTRNLTINLNGKTLIYNGDNRMFKVVDGATLTINGNDIETSSVVVESDNLNESTTAAYIATAYADSKIVINGGAHTTNGCTTYHANGGTIEINSGSFAATEEGYTPAEKYGHKYTLNIQGTDGNIIVRGGRFYKYNPSHSEGENPAANFLEGELVAVAEGDWYMVKEPARAMIVSDGITFKNALQDPNITSIAFDAPINCSNEPVSILHDFVIDMNNNLFTGYNAGGGAPSIGVNGDYDVILKNVNINGNGLFVFFGAYMEFESGKLDINIEVTGNHGFYVVSDKNATSVLRIKGGEFNMVGNDNNDYIYAQGNAIVYIEGGQFGVKGRREPIATTTYDGYTGQVIITGGTFGFDPSTWVADGYTATKSGSTWTVKKDE